MDSHKQYLKLRPTKNLRKNLHKNLRKNLYKNLRSGRSSYTHIYYLSWLYLV